MNTDFKNNAAAEGARTDLQPGESLLHSDIGKAQTSSYGRLMLGVFLIILAVWSYTLGFGEGENTIALGHWQGFILCFFLVVLGVSFIHNGLKNGFLSAGSYFFVTSQRLCLMHKSISGKMIKQDIPIASILTIDVMTSSSGIWRSGKSPGLGKTTSFIAITTTGDKRTTFSPCDPALMRTSVLSAIDEMRAGGNTMDISPDV